MLKVTVYSTPTCPYCKMVKNFLNENKIKFTDIDVATDHEKAHEMIEKSGKEEVMIGFDQQVLSISLGI